MALNFSLPRRTFLAASGAFALGGHPALAQQRKFTIMALGGSWGDAIKEHIARPFGAAAKVELAYDERPNAQQLATLQATRGNPTVDVVELGGPRLGQAIALDLIEPLDAARMPNYAAVHAANKNKFYADRYVAPWALTFNTKFVDRATAQEQGWNLLLDRKYRGRIAIPKFGWMGEMWMNAANLTLGGSYENFDPVVAFCRKIVRENAGLVMESNDQGMKLFQTGEIVAAPFWTGRTYQMADSKLPMSFVYPKGWVPYGGGFVIVKGTRNRALAEQLIELSLAPEVQVAFARKFAYLTTNTKAAPLVQDLERLRIAAADQDRAVNLEYEQIYKYSDRNLERFNRDVVG